MSLIAKLFGRSGAARHDVKRLVIMMPWGRVGSNLLSSLIKGSFDSGTVRFANEPLYQMRDKAKQEAWFRGFYQPEANERLIGSKHALRALEDRDATARLFEELELPVLRMRRDNIVKVAISQERAKLYARRSERETGKAMWGVRKGEDPLPPTPLDAEEFVDTLALVAAEDKALAAFRPDCPLFDLDYETLVASEGKTLAAIFDWIGIAPDRAPQERFVKATPDDLAKAVPNIAELRNAAAKAGLERLDPMFDG
ncbi:MAG: hypothetical protein RLN87_01660 [Parasphingopyxis sp.]|uniref:hypothetical protein n=1 Tax=Parasphingopyxis sp. TaxID=1920299 RepID=UPI0032EFB87A